MSKLSHNLALGAIVIAALAAGLVFGGMIRDDAAENVESDAATQLERYEIGGEFELTNQRGERMRLSDLAGDAVMMFFGYTFCPDICPGDPGSYARGQGRIASRGRRPIYRCARLGGPRA